MQEATHGGEAVSGNAHVVFISYKHEDVAISEKVASQFREIAEAKVNIVLSNHPDFNGAAFGGTLQDEIAKQLQVTEVFFFIYTDPDKDYSWCVYEAGLATRPESLKNTRVIVFSLVDQIPKMFDGKVVVNAKELDQLEKLFRDDFSPSATRRLWKTPRSIGPRRRRVRVNSIRPWASISIEPPARGAEMAFNRGRDEQRGRERIRRVG